MEGSPLGEAVLSCAAPVDIDTPGEYSSDKEFCMTTNRIGTVTLAIDGMSCGHCVQAVSKALAAMPGVRVRSVALGSAVIEAADGWAAGNAVAALEEAGYPAKAVSDAADTVSPTQAKGGGGCCGGSKNAVPGGGLGAKTSGGCCR
jgi:copper chaperone